MCKRERERNRRILIRSNTCVNDTEIPTCAQRMCEWIFCVVYYTSIPAIFVYFFFLFTDMWFLVTYNWKSYNILCTTVHIVLASIMGLLYIVCNCDLRQHVPCKFRQGPSVTVVTVTRLEGQILPVLKLTKLTFYFGILWLVLRNLNRKDNLAG